MSEMAKFINAEHFRQFVGIYRDLKCSVCTKVEDDLCMECFEEIISNEPVGFDTEEFKDRLAEARLVDVDDPYTVVCGIIDEMVGSEGESDG